MAFNVEVWLATWDPMIVVARLAHAFAAAAINKAVSMIPMKRAKVLPYSSGMSDALATE